MRRPRFRLLLVYLTFPLILASLYGWSAPASYQASYQLSAISRQQNGAAVAEIVNAVSKDEFLSVVKGLSGAQPVTIGGQQVTLATRYTPSSQGTLSEQYLYEYLKELGLATQYHAWTGVDRCFGISGRNVVAEI